MGELSDDMHVTWCDKCNCLYISYGVYTGTSADEVFHDDILTWKPFLHYCPFVMGIHWWHVASLTKGQWWRAMMCPFLICKPEQAVNQTVELLVIWDAMELLRYHFNILIFAEHPSQLWRLYRFRDHFVHVSCQWDTMLHCNVSH